MLEALLPPSTGRLVLYPKPVNVRWGADRLRLACESDLGLTLDPTTAVLFHNRKQDTLVLYTLDANGDRCITKKVDRGSPLLLNVSATQAAKLRRDVSRRAHACSTALVEAGS